ncbi:hypothetical protein ES702_02703 [subsurface metagenome]
MAYQTFQSFNQTGLAGLLTYPAAVVPQFIPMLLFAIFSITYMGTYYSQGRLTGRGGDFFSSFALAGFFTAIISILMTLVQGLIGIPTVAICIGISVVSALLLLVTKARD